jgi:alkylation response protein AidB-like acyl-CoA dehydrogenase
VVDGGVADDLLVAAVGPDGVADTIQTLGGIGFTWEHQAHLYFKRATTDAALLGSAEQHRSLVADLMLDTASADGAPRVADGTYG